MKITAKIETEFDVASIVIDIPADEFEYDEMWENEEAKSLPMFKVGAGLYRIEVDADTGRIKNWPTGTKASATFKVCDRGTYELLSRDGKTVGKIEENYVPGCIPGEYGDYIEFNILDDGTWDGFGAKFKKSKIESSFFDE